MHLCGVMRRYQPREADFAGCCTLVTILTGESSTLLIEVSTGKCLIVRHGELIIELEIRSVEHGICPIAEFTSPLLSCAAILAIRP